MTIEAVLGDITRERTDAIVNAATPACSAGAASTAPSTGRRVRACSRPAEAAPHEPAERPARRRGGGHARLRPAVPVGHPHGRPEPPRRPDGPRTAALRLRRLTAGCGRARLRERLLPRDLGRRLRLGRPRRRPDRCRRRPRRRRSPEGPRSGATSVELIRFVLFGEHLLKVFEAEAFPPTRCSSARRRVPASSGPGWGTGPRTRRRRAARGRVEDLSGGAGLEALPWGSGRVMCPEVATSWRQLWSVMMRATARPTPIAVMTKKTSARGAVQGTNQVTFNLSNT